MAIPFDLEMSIVAFYIAVISTFKLNYQLYGYS